MPNVEVTAISPLDIFVGSDGLLAIVPAASVPPATPAG